MLRMNRILFDKAGDGGGGGASGAAGGKGADGGNSGSGAGSGGDAAAGGKAANGNADGKSGGAKDELFGDGGDKSGNNNGSGKAGDADKNNPDPKAGEGNKSVVLPDNWKDALPDELKNDGALGPIKDVPMLVKSYINAQKMIGADKVPIPGKHATTDEWKETFHKLGNPRTLDEYKIEVDKDAKVEKDFVEKFKAQAHLLGILPSQAGPMVAWFDKLNQEVWAQADKEHINALNADMGVLKQEWGAAYEGNVVRAKAAINEFADDGIKKFLTESGMGKRAAFIKFMSKVGESLSEDKIKGSGGNGSGMFGSLTPSQAQAKIEEINTSPKHPYWNPNHENHAAAKKEMQGLYAQAHPMSGGQR